MFDNILAAIPFGIILALTIGPVFFVLLETSITKGFKSALIFDLGVIFADIIFIAVAFYSTSKLVEKIKDDPNFLIFGGVLLVVYGVISFIKTSKSFRTIVREYHKVEIQKRYGKLFIKGFLLNFINIGVLMGWLGFIVIANTLTETTQGVYVFITTILVVYFIIDLFKISVAKKLRSKLTPRRIFKTKKIIALVILGFGVLLLAQGFFPEEDLANGMPNNDLRFRFPPEPNGYLHIGHTKAIGISFGLGETYNVPVNLRFDDTNPTKEEQEYVDAIKRDISWLGYTWAKECYSSDYFQKLYGWAVQLIKDAKAYVDSQSSEAMSEQKGTTTLVQDMTLNDLVSLRHLDH